MIHVGTWGAETTKERTRYSTDAYRPPIRTWCNYVGRRRHADDPRRCLATPSTLSVPRSRFKVDSRVQARCSIGENNKGEEEQEGRRVNERGERRRMIDGENRSDQSLWLRTGEDISSRRRCQDSTFGASRSRTPGARGNPRVQGRNPRHAISVILPPVTCPPPGDPRGISPRRENACAALAYPPPTFNPLDATRPCIDSGHRGRSFFHADIRPPLLQVIERSFS